MKKKRLSFKAIARGLRNRTLTTLAGKGEQKDALLARSALDINMTTRANGDGTFVVIYL